MRQVTHGVHILLRIDTSNYTTSAAYMNYETHTVTQVKKLLTVRPGRAWPASEQTRFFSIPIEAPRIN